MGIFISLFKWLLSLHQMVWFVSGALSFSAITFFLMKHKYDKTFSRGNFTFIVLSALTAAFAILWMYDSYMENEVQAANMGMLVFGGLAVIFALVAHKLKVKKPTVNRD